MLLYGNEYNGNPWNYVFEIDELDSSIQMIRYFDKELSDYRIFNPYTLTSIFENIKNGSWRIVDEKFLETKIHPVIKNGMRISIDMSYGEEVYRVIMIENDTFVLIGENDFSVFAAPLRTDNLTFNVLKDYIGHNFKLL